MYIRCHKWYNETSARKPSNEGIKTVRGWQGVCKLGHLKAVLGLSLPSRDRLEDGVQAFPLPKADRIL